MSYEYSFFYGIIQALAEFLPISSSAHLALFPYLFHFKDPGVLFDLMMHLGTALAVLIYFHRDFYNILISKSRFINYSISIVATVVLALVLKPITLHYGRSELLIAINLMVFGIVLYIVDRVCLVKSAETHSFDKKIMFFESLMIGLSQATALFPGVSRSGITITTGRLMSFSREEAARYSFLLSVPVILGAVVFMLPEIKSELTVSYPVLLIGFFTSFTFGFVTIHFFLKMLRKISFMPFMIYRLVLGALLIYVGSKF